MRRRLGDDSTVAGSHEWTDVHPTKGALVVEEQKWTPRAEVDADSRVDRRRHTSRLYQNLTAHTQVNDKTISAKRQPEELPPPTDLGNSRASKPIDEIAGSSCVLPHGPAIVNGDRHDTCTHSMGLKSAADDFNFRKLGHSRLAQMGVRSGRSLLLSLLLARTAATAALTIVDRDCRSEGFCVVWALRLHVVHRWRPLLLSCQLL